MAYIENIPFTQLGPLQALLDLESADLAVLLAAMEFAEGLSMSATLAGLADVSLTTLSNGQVLEWNSTLGKWTNGSGGGSGSVTSFSAGNLLPLFTTSVANPTTTPALSFALSNAAQNSVLAGPATGGTGAPSYRALVAADIPALSYVTSVGLSSPGVIYTVSGSPVTGSGTLALNLISQTENTFLAAPNGSNGTPTFRTIAVADLPTSGTWPFAGIISGNLQFTGSPLFTNTVTHGLTFYTSGVSNSPSLVIAGSYQSSSAPAYAEDSWTLQDVVGSGLNGTSQLTFSHSGTSGNASVVFPAGSSGADSILFGTTSTGIWGQSSFLNLDAGATNGGVNFYAGSSQMGSVNFGSNLFVLEASPGAANRQCGLQSNVTTAAVYCWQVNNAVAGSLTGTSGTQGVLNVTATFAPTSGSAAFKALSVTPTINQTSSASGNYTAILANVTETQFLGTTARLLDLQVGSASYFNIDHSGNTYINNPAVATSSASQSSPILNIDGTYWNGSASATDSWTIQNVIANGTNGTSNLTFSHSGTSGATFVSLSSAITGLQFLNASADLDFGSNSTWTLNFTNSNGVSNYGSLQGNGSSLVLSAGSGSQLEFFGDLTTQSVASVLIENENNFTGTSGTQKLLNVVGTFAPTSGNATFVGNEIKVTVDQTGSASGSYQALWIQAVETALLGTANLLILAQAGSTGSTTEFTVDNVGNIQTAGGISAGSVSVSSPSAGVFYSGGTAGVTQTAEAVGTLATKGGIVTTFTAVSDERLKIASPYTGGLAEVLAINPVKYRWNERGQELSGQGGDKDYVGFIAQNVQTQIPEAVWQSSKHEYLCFEDRPVIAALVNAIKTLTARIEYLESKVR